MEKTQALIDFFSIVCHSDSQPHLERL
jgi:hypothetical protein